MAQSLVQLTAHLVFHIKSDSVTIRKEDCERLWAFLISVINHHEGRSVQVGGTDNHVHILCYLPKNMAPSAFVEKLKQSSSKWIKTVAPYYRNFYWQAGYGLFSVSQQNVERVRHYIQNQEEHHRTKTAREEYLEFLKAQGIDYDERFVLTD